MDDRRGIGGGLSTAALVILALGIVLLLNTTGILDWGIWFQLLRFWPVILIAVGLSMILGRRAPVISALMTAALLIASVGGATYLLSREPPRDLEVQYYSASMNNTETLELNIDFAAGDLLVEPLGEPEQAQMVSAGLMSADFANMNASVSENRTDELTQIDISVDTPGVRIDADEGDWNLNISPLNIFWMDDGLADWRIGVASGPIVRLNVQGGASDIDMRLSSLNVKSLTMDVGAADIDIELPEFTDQTDISISAGAADIDIVVPDGVSALITADTVVSSIDIDTVRFPMRDGVYRSPGYDAAENRVEISIGAGASSISIH